MQSQERTLLMGSSNGASEISSQGCDGGFSGAGLSRSCHCLKDTRAQPQPGEAALEAWASP